MYRWQGTQAQESQMECKMESFNKVHGVCSITLNVHKHTNMGTKTRRAPIQQSHYTDNKTISDKDMRGNRGLNTQQVMNGIENRCMGRQDKTNGK